MSDSQRVAKNTIYMYIRMILIMLVSIYTSRVVLEKLGVDDYGLYSAVASVIAMVNFLNQTLSTSTSRFLAYDIGKRDEELLRNTFSTAFFSHLFLALLIIVMMESVGLWYMTNKFVIPEGRESVVFIVYQLSIVITALSVCIVPYKGLLVAYEDMSIYAYVGILEALLQLMVAYLLTVSPIDKLTSYACLLLTVQIFVACVYVTICLKKYACSKLKLYISKTTFKKMLGFSGWTAIANLSNTLTDQGSILLLNLFFSPAIIASKAISDQVSSAINIFINNFRAALNPSIIKTIAANDFERGKRMTLMSTIVSFDMILILGLPFVFTIETVLALWLVEVPPLAVFFTRIAIISQIIGSISTSTYIAFVSSGKLTSNAICGIITGFAFFVFLYLIFQMGGEALWVQYLSLVFALIWVLLLRPLFLNRDVNYTFKEVFKTYLECFKVAILSVLFSFVLYVVLPHNIYGQILLFVGVAGICLIISYCLMDAYMKGIVKEMVFSKIKALLRR
jgi:O-antigen/teichoic acid export membrane protein